LRGKKPELWGLQWIFGAKKENQVMNDEPRLVSVNHDFCERYKFTEGRKMLA
jgi:hypothetical protein